MKNRKDKENNKPAKGLVPSFGFCYTFIAAYGSYCRLQT